MNMVWVFLGPVRGIDFHKQQPLFVSGGDDYKIKVRPRCERTLHCERTLRCERTHLLERATTAYILMRELMHVSALF